MGTTLKNVGLTFYPAEFGRTLNFELNQYMLQDRFQTVSLDLYIEI